jgi:hypothetical protein
VRPSSRPKGPEGTPKGPEGGEGPRKSDKRRTEGGTTDQFRPPRCGLCDINLCAPGPSSGSSSCQTLPDGVSPNTEGAQTADGRWE